MYHNIKAKKKSIKNNIRKISLELTYARLHCISLTTFDFKNFYSIQSMLFGLEKIFKSFKSKCECKRKQGSVVNLIRACRL